MKLKKRGSVFWLKGLGILLIVILVFTLASRVADSFTVPKVRVTEITGRRIQHAVSAVGRIEANQERAVITEPNILIESVAVRGGQFVESGDLLFQLDMESITEQIDEIERNIQSLELQNQQIRKNQNLENEQRTTNLKRANEDYTDTVRRNKKAVNRAKQELKEAQEALKKAEQELKEAQSDEEREEKEEAYEACKTTVAEKKEALKAAKDTQQTERQTSARAVEDAKTPQSSDNSMELNALTMEELQVNLGKLEKLRDDKGKITAPESGVITGIQVTVGQKTMDTAAVTMSDENAGFRFVAQIGAEDMQYVAVGDTVNLSGVGKKSESCEITSVEADEDGENYSVTVQLKEDTFRLGETATMSVVQESEEYPYTVPITSLFQSDNKVFVLVLDKENTVLGEQYVARKTEVDVLDKNSSYAAIDNSALGGDVSVITDMDRYVEAGERVRLMED